MSKKLVAYFSPTGTTKKAAAILAEAAEADLFEIKPVEPYTEADLNWRDDNARSTVEMKDLSFRPPVAERVHDMDKYDTLLVCFPIWWYIAPTIINTFLESYNLHGKTVMLFATSGGSGLGKTLEKLEDSCSGAILTEGKMLNGKLDTKELSDWFKKLPVNK